MPGHRSSSAGSVLRRTGRLPASGVASLRHGARSTGMSWPRFIVAAVAAYMCRMPGRDEAILSVPVAGRVTARARRAPTTMANVLPLRVSASGDMSVLELARRAGQDINGLLEHQRFRGERLRRELNWPRDDR